MMDALSPLERRLRERRYETASHACVAVLEGLGLASSDLRVVALDELELTWSTYLARLRKGSDTAEHWSAAERGAVQLRLDQVSDTLGSLPVVWLALVDGEPVGVEAPSDALLRAALTCLVTGAGDLMLTTRDTADGLCVEFNHLATGDEYEVVAWGVFAYEQRL